MNNTTLQECDKPQTNKDIETTNWWDWVMATYRAVTYKNKKGSMQVILEFPDEKQDTTQLQEEVRKILQCELQTKLQKKGGKC